MSQHTITISEQQFYREVVEFRKIMCSKKYWNNGEPIPILEKAFQTLTSCYFACTNSQKVEPVYQATVNEFSRRQIMLSLKQH